MVDDYRRRGPFWGRAALAVVVAVLVVIVASTALTLLGDRDGGAGSGQAPSTPPGAAFYEASDSELAAGDHGSVIRSRRLVAGPTIGGTTHLVLYRSTSAKGEPVAVSGVVSVPDGEPPDGGWPVISWGHGTTGTADRCAPSRSGVDPQTGVYSASMDAVTTDLVEEGYAVLRTDYEGLGTPGPHPYLMGQSAGAAMTDIVAAAHEIVPDLSPEWVAMGHSQGGQAALFTSRFTGAYSSGLDLVGVVALAPPSQLGPVVDMVAAGGDATAQEQEAQESTSGSSAFLGPLLVSAARTADVPVEEMLGPKGRRLLPHLEERCIAELFAADSFGGLDPGELLAPGADPGRLRRTVGTNDAAEVHPQVPVLLLQGGADTTVPQLLSDRLAGQYRDRGTDLEYVVLPDADHISLLPDGASRVHAWVAEAFAG